MVFNYDDFKQIMKSASKFTSNDEDRPRLTYIKFTVKDNKLKVESLDGYRALRFTRKLADNNEDFTAFLKPECFIKGNFKEVILEKDKITYKGGYFKELMISLSEVEGVFPDLDTIYPDYKNEYKGQAENIAFNPHYFADISKVLPRKRLDYIEFFMPNTKVRPIVCTYTWDNDLYEFLLLPVIMTI